LKNNAIWSKGFNAGDDGVVPGPLPRSCAA